MWNGTMFVDLDWPLNASSLLSASAELLVAHVVIKIHHRHHLGNTLLPTLVTINRQLAQFWMTATTVFETDIHSCHHQHLRSVPYTGPLLRLWYCLTIPLFCNHSMWGQLCIGRTSGYRWTRTYHSQTPSPVPSADQHCQCKVICLVYCVGTL